MPFGPNFRNLTFGEPSSGFTSRPRSESHPISNGDRQVTIAPTTWVGQPLSDANEEVPMVTQLDEKRQRLWEMAKANLEKAQKRYKDFVDKAQ